MKVLIVSGIPIRNDSNNGKTLQSLFSGFSKDELCHLYFSPASPNVDMCRSYYQLCEKQMLKSCFGLIRSKCGRVIYDISNAEPQKSNALLLTKNKDAIGMRLAREMVWRLTAYKNQCLKNWLEEQSADVIFAALTDTNSTIQMLRWIARKTKRPLVLYIADDYYTDPQRSANPLRRMYYARRQTLIKGLAPHIKALIGGSEKLSSYFSEALQINGTVASIYTPAAPAFFELPLKKAEPNTIVKIRYFGNLGLGRWQMLKVLGEFLREINQHGVKAMLEVYSSDTDPVTHKALTIERGCTFKGWTSGQAYLDLLQDTDVAVHLESFDENNIHRTWGTISTKIADYLGAGKCILAIGPSYLASIEHLADVACTVNDLSQLKCVVERLVENGSFREELQYKARRFAAREHDIKQINAKIRDHVESVISMDMAHHEAGKGQP